MRFDESFCAENRDEDVVDRYLRSLSDEPAPASLLPRVRAAIAERAFRPWWQRPYTTWTTRLQGLVLLAAASCLIGMSWLLPQMMLIMEQSWTLAWSGALGGFVEPLWTLGTGLALIIQRLLAQVPMPLFYLFGGMMCIGYLILVGTASMACRLVQLQNVRY